MISVNIDIGKFAGSAARIDALIDQLPRAFSDALNYSLYDTRDQLVHATWIKETPGPGGRKLRATQRRDIGRRALRVLASDEHNLKGSIEISQESPSSPAVAARKALSAQDWIRGFVHSQAPVFWGKSKKERIRMALGAYYRLRRTREYQEVAAKLRPEVFIDDFIRIMTNEAERQFPRQVMRAWNATTKRT